MADLPADYHTAVLWHDVEGLSTAEIAAALGISVANVKSRLHRGRLFLRKRLTEAMTA
jgi:RNA polymerase sigma-70 factor (ECF subfamily)